MKILLLLSLIISAFNTGLIWLVQLVHYPGFAKIGSEAYKGYQEFHMRSISWIVGPSMFSELALTAFGFFYWQQFPHKSLYVIATGLVLIIWINTAVWAVPSHTTLVQNGQDQALISRLVQINWWRTISWTIRTCLLAYMVYDLIKP